MAIRAKVAYSVEQVMPPSGGPARLKLKPVEPKASTVTVIGIYPRGILSFITSKIREGPLYKVETNADNGYVEITFQQSEQAADFVESDRFMNATLGYGRFGPGYSIVDVKEFEWDAEIRGMAQPPRERRRLTFAKARLLGNHLSFMQFQEDVAVAAGGPNAIDIAWAYNTGNVTVAFKSVQVAKAVKRYFTEQSTKNNIYRNLVVTFSTDPCEKPLFLGSQMPFSTNDTARNNHWVNSQKIEKIQANGQKIEDVQAGIREIIGQSGARPAVNAPPLKAQPVAKQQAATQQSNVVNHDQADAPKAKTRRRGLRGAGRVKG
ncbi:hypothetical protein FQN49_006856 [Arthroderma sp. PD_2]|nr:hypothetical protein FQN49_006856 [Arthroderma sp. PD_2]